MNDHAGPGAARGGAVPRPAGHSGPPHGAAPGLAPGAVPQQESESRRAGVRDALDGVLGGVALRSRDRQFLARLVKWDKRNAMSVVSLLWRARLAGRAEAALTRRQLEIVLGALSDAAAYRASGADSVGCRDCENIPAGRCAEHAKDLDRAAACTELASVLGARDADSGEHPQPAGVAGYRSVTTVAS